MNKNIKNIKKFYDPKTYKPTKNSVPVSYKGTQYLSKAQCMALEGITRKELDEYLKGGNEKVMEPQEDPIDEQMAYEEEVEQILADEAHDPNYLPF